MKCFKMIWTINFINLCERIDNFTQDKTKSEPYRLKAKMARPQLPIFGYFRN